MTKPDDARDDLLAQAEAWLSHLRSGRVTPDELQAFRAWCAEHPDMARRLRRMWTNLPAAEALAAQREAQATHARADYGKHNRRLRQGRRAFVGFAVAAGASWLALRPPLQLWPALTDFRADYRTGTGERREIALSGRVTVDMNTQTRIDVLPGQAGLSAQHGIDLLAGEAEIAAASPAPGRVTPIRPILVTAGRGRLQAEVARFNVRRTDNQVCVTCVSGSVLLDHPKAHLTLLASQQLVYDDRGVRRVAHVDPDTVTAWRRGVLVFDNMRLDRAIDEINRYRPGKVILRNKALNGMNVEAQSPIAKLDTLIDTLSAAYGVHVTRLPGDIVLLS